MTVAEKAKEIINQYETKYIRNRNSSIKEAKLILNIIAINTLIETRKYGIDLLKEMSKINMSYFEHIFRTIFFQNRYAIGEAFKRNDTEKTGTYNFIQIQPNNLLWTIETIKRELGDNVLNHTIDIGCGTGNAITLLKMCETKNVVGIEIDEELAETARWNMDFLKLNNVEIIYGDAFKHHYNKYTLINMYRPIANNNKMVKLYRKITREMMVGAVLVDHYTLLWHPKNTKRKYGGMPVAIQKISKYSFREIL